MRYVELVKNRKINVKGMFQVNRFIISNNLFISAKRNPLIRIIGQYTVAVVNEMIVWSVNDVMIKDKLLIGQVDNTNDT